MEDEFDILAAKVLAGEALPEEHARLKELLSQSLERREEFAGLKAAWVSLKATAPISQLLEAPQAEIPEQRLRQLQQVVRARTNAANMPATLHGHRAAPSGSDVPLARASGTLSPSKGVGWGEGVSVSICRWLQRKTGVAPVPLFAAALLLFCAVGLAFWFLQPRIESPSGTSPNETLAYLLVQKGTAEVIRAGKALPATNATSLRSTDELRLAPAVQVTLLTRTGAVMIAGPLNAAIAKLAPRLATISSESKPDTLCLALFQPVPELRTAGLLVTMRNGQGIPLYSPAGATANLTPPILWKNRPDATYDIIIIDEFDSKTPPWRVSGVTSPVEFANVPAWKARPLAKDGLYRLRLSETGRPLTACDYTFRTTADATGNAAPAPAAPIADTVQILTAESSRVGDALALLLRLPPEQADTELALRLKLLLFGQLGCQADFDTTLAKLQLAR